MQIALYPGTFDPVTNGHVDIVQRASHIFPKVIAVVADNPSKNCLFSVDDRVTMVRQALTGLNNVIVIKYAGLVADCVNEYNATVIIRGLRALSDFDYEFQMAFTNRQLNKKADTVFLMPSARYTYLSSTLVRQLAQFGGDVSQLIPECVVANLEKKFQKTKPA
ncbi:MAG: pantetheine-phosphate adenylyltransferase [Chitinivibrionales bacterium]|nr:pantetheine-phosphate adenylyltransferase [Chitinivibrionales bacterium]